MIGKLGVAALASAVALSAPAVAIETPTRTGLSAAQMFEIAGQAVGDADNAAAITIYEALARDPDVDVRCEARYRHGQLLLFGKKYREAAVLFRAILDEKPDAGRVRLELAGVLMAMGDDGGARRELRQAQAGGLPPDVVRVVDQFQGALRANQPIGGSLEIALAPSTNINRATSATTIDTVIAPFDLSKDAQAQSGLGARIGGQGYLRLPVTDRLRWTLRGSGQGVFYRKSQFNDVAVAAETGLELTTGKSRLQPSIGRIWRWFGGEIFTVSDTANLSWLRRIGARSQLDASIGYGRNDFRLNDLQDGNSYDASAALEHAIDARSGGRAGLSVQRQTARDPGFATWSGGGNMLYWHEIGQATVFATAGLSHLVGDERLALFPQRRIEWLARAGLAASLRQLTVRGFAPVVRINFERNWSTVGIYDYRRLSVDFGLNRAF